MNTRFLAAVFITLALAGPQATTAFAATLGGPCTSEGSWQQGDPPDGDRHFYCDGSVWKIYLDHQVSGNNVRQSLQIGHDTGACTAEKLGRLSYDDSSDTWFYCDGSTWQVVGEGGASATPCTDDASIECLLEATRANDDPQFIASNIRTGVNILNVTGSLANCSNDSTGECILAATRSSSDAQFLAANIKDGVNILGVTGSYADGGISDARQLRQSSGGSGTQSCTAPSCADGFTSFGCVTGRATGAQGSIAESNALANMLSNAQNGFTGSCSHSYGSGYSIYC